MKIQVNTEAFVQGMQNAEEEYRRRILAAMESACGQLADAAKQRVPKGEHIPSAGEDDKGPLRDSIRYAILQDGANGKIVGAVGSEALYAVWYHEGTGLFSRTGLGRGQPGGKQKKVPWHYQDGLGHWHTTSGNEPNLFLEEAADEMRGRIAATFYAHLRDGGGK